MSILSWPIDKEGIRSGVVTHQALSHARVSWAMDEGLVLIAKCKRGDTGAIIDLGIMKVIAHGVYSFVSKKKKLFSGCIYAKIPRNCQ